MITIAPGELTAHHTPIDVRCRFHRPSSLHCRQSPGACVSCCFVHGARSPGSPGYHFIVARSLSHPFISSPMPSLLAAVRQTRASAPAPGADLPSSTPSTARRVDNFLESGAPARDARKSKQREKSLYPRMAFALSARCSRSAETARRCVSTSSPSSGTLPTGALRLAVQRLIHTQ